MRAYPAALLAALALAATPAAAVEPETAILAPSLTAIPTLTTVSGTATDADGTIANVQVRLCDAIVGACWNDGTSMMDVFLQHINPESGWFNATATDGTFDSASEAWNDPIITAALAATQGQFIIEARAVDDASDKDTSPATITITLDATAPDTAIITPEHGTNRLATAEIGGTYVDLAITTVQVRVQDLTSGNYWDGATGFGATEIWSTATITGPFFTQVFGATLVKGRSYNVVSKGFDQAGNAQSVFTVGAASITFTHSDAPPSTASVTGLFLTSATASWALTYGATGYTLAASLSPNLPPTVAVSSQVAGEFNTAATLTGLTPNTTYSFFVNALGPSSATAYGLFATSATLANPPTTTVAAGVAATSATLSWNANSNGGGTLYEAQASLSAGFGAIAASSATRNTSATMTGLIPNTTYHLRVRAVSHGGTATAYDTAVSSATDANVPVSPSASTVNSQASLTWGANSNPAGTRYTAQLSTASDFTGTVASSVTLQTSATFFSLDPATAYFLRVRATGHNGSVTAFTSNVSTTTAAVSAPGDAMLTGIHIDSATASWSLVVGATGYLVLASSLPTNPPTIIQSADNTVTPPAILLGLDLNTTYYFFIASFGGGQTSSYTLFATSSTGVSPPTVAAANGVTNTTVAMTWNANTNPAGTLFQAQAATDVGFTSPATSATFNTSASFASLTPNTTYHLRVRAVSHNGTASAYSATASSATEANAPVTPVATANSNSQITLTWGENSNAAGTTRYTAQLSTASDFTGTLTTNQVVAASNPFGGLAAGTTYFMRVRADGHNGTNSAFSATASTVTLTTLPTVISGTVKTPGGTGINAATLELTDSGSLVIGNTNTGTDSSGAWSFTGLTPAASYTVRARFTGSNGIATEIQQAGHIPGGGAVALVLATTLSSIDGTITIASAGLRRSGALSAASSGSGAYVEVYKDGQLAGTVPVDAQGRFSVPNLLPGSYTLRAFNGASFTAMTTVDLAPGQALSLTFAGELLPEDKVYFYPNPARNQAVIRFESGTPGLQAQAVIFDITGALVRKLAAADATTSGAETSWTWDLANAQGRAVASGVYIVQVSVLDPATSRGASVTKKLAVVR